MTELETKLGYAFKDASLLETALTTPACRMDRSDVEDNQRLEFLGDAVFGLLSADAVFAAYPWEREGTLTVRRTHLVSGAALAEAAERIGLRDHLKRNAGAAPLAPRAKALADAMEAVMGATWLDGGLDAARKVFGKLDLPIDEKLNEWSENPKGHLQVLAQARHPPRKPEYVVDKSEGPSHAPTVTVTVSVAGFGSATATAGSQRAAEVAAAASLLEKLEARSDLKIPGDQIADGQQGGPFAF
ncbi:MAG: putative dsRNA-binding protein [Kiritimatiellae bacterium]|nr:putative dsRNA-binding protein [Kiritimatiellia bacterium]